MTSLIQQFDGRVGDGVKIGMETRGVEEASYRTLSVWPWPSPEVAACTHEHESVIFWRSF